MTDDAADSRANEANGALSRDESGAHSHVPLDADRPPNSGWDDLEQRWVPMAEDQQRDEELSGDELMGRLYRHLRPYVHVWLVGATEEESNTPEDRERWARLALRVWSQIATGPEDPVAREWFITANPLLDGDTPVTAVRKDREIQVFAAAAAFRK